jgi:hypothetical protein
MLVTVYDDGGEVVEGPVGFTSDHACVDMAAGVADRAVGEWRMWKIGRAPEGLRLIRTVIAAGLDRYPHRREWWPLVEAAMQWAKLGLPGKLNAVHDYRTAGARVIRARRPTPEARLRKLAAAQSRAQGQDMQPVGIRQDETIVYELAPISERDSIDYAPVAGPHSTYPRTT